MQTFMTSVADARRVALWLNVNRQQFTSQIDEPWVTAASDDEVLAFCKRQLAQGATLDDLRDELLFDFNSSDDIGRFLKATRELHVNLNVSLFGAQHLKQMTNSDMQ
jgi:hypothetical protein